MTGVLVAIGCETYAGQGIDQLPGASIDAQRFFDTLIDCGADYDKSCSLHLSSPTLSDVQQQLSLLIPTNRSIDTLTFYFAGHGCLRGGTFYLCLRDSLLARISSTAYPLNNLLSFIQEVAPKQANIIIDACQSGALTGDIGRALDPETIGTVGSTGISIFVACAKDQSAYESLDGGYCTNALLDCISGRTFVQDVTEQLDLIEVARQASDAVRKLGVQEPIYWGLNLSGRPRFCLNPHYSSEGPLRQTIAETSPFTISAEMRRRLWAAYREVHHDWSPTALRNVLVSLDQAVIGDERKILFFRQVALSFSAAARGDADPFRELEVQITCLAPLLRHCVASAQIAAYVEIETRKIAVSILRIGSALDKSLRENPDVLVGDALFGEFFYLPLRIAKILGWLGAALCVLGEQKEFADATGVFKTILENFSTICIPISDEQAAYLIPAIIGFSRVAKDACETYLGLLFCSICDSKGRIAACALPPEDVVDLVLARAYANYAVDERLLAKPSSLILVILLMAHVLRLENEFDHGLEDLDHLSINAFLPESYADFADERIERGVNATFKIGEGVWTISDLLRLLKKQALTRVENSSVRNLSLCCSLIFPDRVAWHLWSEEGYLELALGTGREPSDFNVD